MSIPNVDDTIKEFRKQQRDLAHHLLNPIVFALAVSELGTSGAGSLLEFALAPVIASTSDRRTRKSLLLYSIGLLAAARGGDWLRKVAGYQTTLFSALAQGILGGALATAKASTLDFCDDTVAMSKSAIKLAGMGVLGSLCNPLFVGLSRRLLGRDTAPEFVAALIALGAAIAILVEGEQGISEVGQYVEDSLITYTPFSFARLASSNREAPKAMAASFFSQIAGGLAIRELVEQLVRSTSPMASARLRILLAMSFASIAGTAVSWRIQDVLGLYDQASIAGVGQAATAGALVLNRPYVAAAIMILSQRPSDVSDLFLLENRTDGGGRGETCASIANWHALASVVGPITLGFVHSKAGMEGVAATILGCTMASEYLRRSVRAKMMYPDQ